VLLPSIITGFRRDVDVCVLLGYYTTSDNSLPTFRDNLLVPSFWISLLLMWDWWVIPKRR